MAPVRVTEGTCEIQAQVTAARATPLATPSLVSYTRLSDERLARAVASGGERPFEAIYERYHQPLYGYCYSIVRSEADAQDALQSAFAKALVALRQGRRSAPLRPWLYRIAHNEAVSILRERRAAERRLEQQRPALSHAPSAADRAGDRASLAALLADLEQVPERARGALVMRELGGLSHEQIAAALGLSVGAAKQAIFEARTTLAEFAEGRTMTCDEVMRRLSDGDRRVLRGRRVRAHLRGCASCTRFATAIPARKAELQAVVPMLAPAAAAALLEQVLEGARGHGASLATAGSGAAGPGASSGGSIAQGAGSGSSASVSGSATAGIGGSVTAGTGGLAASFGASSAGMLAKTAATLLAPKALLALTAAAGIAAGSVALVDPAGHPAAGTRGSGHATHGQRAHAGAVAGGSHSQAPGTPGSHARPCPPCGGASRGRSGASRGRADAPGQRSRSATASHRSGAPPWARDGGARGRAAQSRATGPRPTTPASSHGRGVGSDPASRGASPSSHSAPHTSHRPTPRSSGGRDAAPPTGSHGPPGASDPMHPHPRGRPISHKAP